MVIQVVPDQPAQGFWDGEVVGVVTNEEVRQAVEAEFLTFSVARFGDAVGVEQQAVPGFQLDAA